MNKTYVLVVAIVLIVGAIYFLDKEDKKIEVNTSSEFSHELVGIAGYINTENYGGDTFQLQDYIGKKVILVDFWTYTCINCQRTLPYITSWHEKYSDKCLLIVGVHTPEFEFEKKIENVKNAVQEFGIQYPVVQDNDYATWRAYKNNYWPHKYLIDINGDIVYDHVGEGGYRETEMKIQQLLEERMQSLGTEEDIDVALTSGGDVSVAQSPETYFGAWRNSNLGNGVRGVVGIQQFELLQDAKPNTLYLSGTWDVQQQFARSGENASIVFYYSAKKVFMVARAEKPVKVSVLVDSQPVGERSGKDIINNVMTVQEERLYEVIVDKEPGAHVLQLVAEPGFDVFTFTFG